VVTLVAAEVIEVAPVTVVGQAPPFPAQPQAVTIIDREQLARTDASSLADVLDRAGFAIKRYGAAGAVAGLTLRGSGADGVLILRDGVRLNDPQNGGVDLSTVPLTGVDRVEILAGGASGLYGADAVGGVINLVTAVRPGTRLEVGGGTFGTGHMTFDLGVAGEDADTGVAFRRGFAQNDFPYLYRDLVSKRANARLDATDVSLRHRRYLGPDTVDATLAYTAQGKGVPGTVNFPSPRASQDDESLLGSVRWVRTPPDGGAAPTLSLSHRHSVIDYRDPDFAFGPPRTRNVVETTDLRGKLALRWTPGSATASASTSASESETTRGHALEIGAGLTRDALDNTGFGFRQRYVGSVFARDALDAAPGVQVFADGRADLSSQAGPGFSPRAGVAWRFGGGRFRWRGAFGQSYRAPTFNDLYWPTTRDAGGNPDLKPETTATYETGLDAYPLDGLKADVTGFYNLGRSTIVWQPGIGGRWTPINLGATETRGIEARATLRMTAFLTATGNHTWLQVFDRSVTGATAGKILPFRPERVTSASLRLELLAGLTLSATWLWVGDRFATAANTETLPAYDLLSADLGWALTAADTLRLSGENLLNTYYILQPGYPMPGRALSLAWAHTF
jgi:outer membrane cobalamin receptor